VYRGAQVHSDSSDHSHDEEKYADAVGNALVEWWDKYFGPRERRDSRPLRKDVDCSEL